MRPTAAEKIPPENKANDGMLEQPTSGSRGRWLSTLRVALPLLILAGAAVLASYLVRSKPRARRRPPTRQAALVEVSTVEVSPTQRVIVEAMGTVRSAQQLELHPRVRGEVVAVSKDLVPGGILKAGETILRIDPADYALGIKQAQSAVIEAESSLKVERGNQSIAHKEFEMLGEVVAEEDRELVLRKPQLDKARAALDAAQATLAKAKLDLERTTIRAPFNAVVKARHVALGTRVSESTNLATLVGTDAYWVEVGVPVDELKWLEIPQVEGGAAAEVRIYNEPAWGGGVSRAGCVLRLAAELEEKGRLARLLVEIDDPLALKPENAGAPRLLIGSYVRVEIVGAQLDSVTVLDRRLLHDGNRVWVMNKAGRLDIRVVSIAFHGPEHVFIESGITPGDVIVTSPLPTPVQGMPLRTERQPTSSQSKPDTATEPEVAPQPPVDKEP